MERKEGLKKIRSEEEYDEVRQRLDEYLVQYKWLTESKNPLEDIFKSLAECSKIRNSYEEGTEEEREIVDTQEQIDNEHRILSLKRQFDELKNGTYVASLRRNITALYIIIGEYEARMEKTNSLKQNEEKVNDSEANEKDSKGQIQNYVTSGKYRRLRYFWASLTGAIPGEIVNMDIEDKNEIPLFIKKKYGLIAIVDEQTPLERMRHENEKSLVVAGARNEFSVRVAKKVDEFISEKGIIVKGKETQGNVEEKASDEKVVTENVVNNNIASEKTKDNKNLKGREASKADLEIQE